MGKEKNKFSISLAGYTIAIESQYSEVYNLCKEYESDLSPEINITITEDDLAYERSDTVGEGYLPGDGYLETLAVYRKICEALLEYDIILMHGAVVAYNNIAYMFTAPSGTGKTTHIKKWLENLKDSYVVNGDKPLIKITETEVMACGTPWRGKESLGTNKMVPLKAIVLMERGANNLIREISFTEAFAYLLKQTYHPRGTNRMKKTLQLFLQLKGKVTFYYFIFNNMKEDAFSVANEALTGGICDKNG